MDQGATTYYYPVRDDRPGLISRFKQGLIRARDWLDEKGRPAWIATMIAAFIFVWPVGLAILFYMIGSNRMTGCANRRKGSVRRYSGRTGNSAFDAYREETLKRLEDEHEEFMSFLTRLREARDKAEFDQFMSDRRDRRQPEDSDAPSQA
ncbi:DUF2852 domain-containing protein [Paracoccus aurantiacus]|uniref:DUF2852 domain-containing protein n=1 Tax=Paracoccus aurantiacus TaxID=2599412 RepID=A0A5C6S3A1_9RHOB|nr:DUF2852 domain-containing protein [Paracoccus aurantiacus]TXB68979.1 DUF2852 domain-containing protein [Paracoccus aurantiacus]